MLPENLAGNPAVRSLRTEFPDAILEASDLHGELTLVVNPAQIAPVCAHLRQTQGFERLSSVTCVDRYPMEPRFEVVYHLHSITRNQRLRLKCLVDGDHAELASVSGVWKAAEWYEREVFDMFGVTFRGHPDLRRILMPDDWQGHPLRKDFPVHGYKYSYKDE